MPQKIETILEQASARCCAAEVFHQTGEVRSVRFENNKLKRIDARQYEGVGLRVFAEGRIGFASTTDLRDPEKLVHMAVASAQFGEEPRFELPPLPDETPEVVTSDPAVEEVTQEQLVEMGREALIMSRETNDEFLFSANLSTRSGTERILNSRGLDFSQTGTGMSAGAEIQEVRDSGLLQVHEYKSWGRPFDSIRDIAGEALEKMEKGRIVASPGREVMPMVFTPKAVDNLLRPIMTALNGKLVHKGSSILAGRIGEQVIDPRISIGDDPTIDYAPASGPVDNEGLPARRLPLIEEGTLRNYLLDLQTAALLEMEPTANGYRSYSRQPSPSSTNTVVAAGEADIDEIVASMDTGLIVDQTLGSGQSNTLAGEFSVNVALGFVVRDGKVQGRVKDAMVAGNVYELLSEVEGVGQDRRWMGSDLVPAICVSGIKLAEQN